MKCKKCESNKICKDGHKDNKQAYKCKECNHSFFLTDDRANRGTKYNKEILKVAKQLLKKQKTIIVKNGFHHETKTIYPYSEIRERLKKRFPEFLDKEIPPISYLSKLQNKKIIIK